jgi:hypothetical protein
MWRRRFLASCRKLFNIGACLARQHTRKNQLSRILLTRKTDALMTVKPVAPPTLEQGER